MRYAESNCTFTPDGDHTVVAGPFAFEPGTRHSVRVKTTDLEAYRSGAKKYVQDAFPYLSADDREFLISGTSPAAWDRMFPNPDNDED